MELFAVWYQYFAKHRGYLLLALLALILLSAWQLSRLKIEESISALLPDGDSQVAKDFHLLQKAPFARKLVIHVTAGDAVDTPELLAATDDLKNALPGELFVNAISGPGDQVGSTLLDSFGSLLPLLADAKDLQQIDARLTSEQVGLRLQSVLNQFLQPQGVALKKRLRRDPLALEDLALFKLQYVNPVPEVRIENGQFVSRDGRSCLILADTLIEVTDSRGGGQLLAAFSAARQQLPAGIHAELISGHPYTVANAATIQQDMSRVLIVSLVGILLLFVVFLRSLRALFVYLLPLFSFAVALLAVSYSFPQVSGITIGFGAVLLGITIDFGLHVYFALRQDVGSPELQLRAVSRPVLFGAMTSLAAFAVLLRSELPGQRQLALFAMAGIAAAVLLALVVLPHFMGRPSQEVSSLKQSVKQHIYLRAPRLRATVLIIWLLIVGISAVLMQQLSINGELRELSYQPESLRKNEQALAATWGDMRGRALVFVAAENLETALQKNEQVWQLLLNSGAKGLVSLAPVLPSLANQQKRLERWQEFWLQRRAQLQDLLIAYGQDYGFTKAAFQPFWVQVEHPPEPFGVERLRQLGLSDMLDNLLLETDDGYQLLSLLPDDPALIAQLQQKIDQLPGVTLVSQSRFGQQLSQEIGRDFQRFISSAGLAVLLLLVLLFRRISKILLAILPVLTGLLVMFAGMVLLGLELNLFNLVASILIIGLGVDYGIFMVCHADQEEELASARAILISGLTTLVGFGSLVFAEHPALHSIGITVLLGISAAVPTAVLVIPAFRPKRV